MPDSFPLPPEGPQPHDERALDFLLSADPSDVPPSLRPVADTLNALRAAPSPRELRGEAAARERFRAVFHEAQGGPGAPATLEMPVPAQRRRGAHVRAVRRRPLRARLAGLSAAAAVLVLAAVAVTYTGNLPGRLQRIAHETIAAPPGRPASGPATPGTHATSARPAMPPATAPAASAPASPPPAPSSTAPGKKALCDQFWSDLERSRPGRTAWQTPRYSQLVTAAGGPQNVYRYCYPVWGPRFGPRYQRLSSHPPYFPRQWGPGGPRGNGQNQPPGQRREPARQPGSGPGSGSGSDQGKQPGHGNSGGSRPGNSRGGQPGGQGQGSGSPGS